MEVDNRPLMVTVQCPVFNHKPYIRQCLEGIVMQKTNFRFEAIVHDDASTDGTADIIREYEEKYPDIIKPIYETENQYSKRDGSLRRILNEHAHGKYVAVCEGDDYWLDPLKLQKQFDILENDEGISMCHHNFYEIIGEKRTLKVRDVPQRQDILSIANNNQTQTLTMFFRNIQPLIPDDFNGKTVYSQFWALRLAEIGDIYYIDEPMAVYRRHEGGVFGKQKLSNKFVMIVTNLDNMIYWSNKNGRRSVVNILKKRGRKTAFSYFFAFIKRYDLKNAITALKILYKYC